MDIFCPACQKKLQIADSYAGQMVKCPSCASNFQAPALPGVTPLPLPEPPVAPPALPVPPPPPAAAPIPIEPYSTYSLAAEPARPEPPRKELVAAPPVEAPPADKLKRDFAHSFTITLRQDVVTLLPPLGLLLLFFLSFFPWRHAGLTTLNFWELAFSHDGFTEFLVHFLLVAIAAPVILAVPFLNKRILPTPPALRPYLPWSAAVIVVLIVPAWVVFLIHYFHCTFMEPWDPAMMGMKLGFRIFTIIAVAAFVDWRLQRRYAKELPEPTLKVRW